MKTIIFIISIFISANAYSQSKTSDLAVNDRNIDSNEWILSECNFKDPFFAISHNQTHDSLSEEAIIKSSNSQPLTPKIKCPKKISYKLADNVSLNGLTKLVYHIN